MSIYKYMGEFLTSGTFQVPRLIQSIILNTLLHNPLSIIFSQSMTLKYLTKCKKFNFTL